MWGASKSQGYEEEQNFPPPAHHCWCPLATKGLQFAAEWCRARASAWSSWKSQQAQLQLTCQKLPLPTKVYLTNSSGVTDHLVPVVTTKALVCYQHYVSAYVYLYIYIPLSLSTPICNQSPSIPLCQQKINPQIQPSRTIHQPSRTKRFSKTSNHWWDRTSSSPTTQASEKRSRRFLIGLAYLEFPRKGKVGGKIGTFVGVPNVRWKGTFMDLFVGATMAGKSWWSSLSTHWLHVDLSGLVQNHLEMLFWSWRLNLVKSRQASSLQHCFIFPGSCQAQKCL